MPSYDQNYSQDPTLFGEAYPEFTAFIKSHGHTNGRALDLGCGQGRDALMLARHGYSVTGVDASKVGIAQLEERAAAEVLSIQGIVGNLFEVELGRNYDLILLDSVVHFGKKELKRELILLDDLVTRLSPGGYFIVFVHQTRSQVSALKKWMKTHATRLSPLITQPIPYIYEEQHTGFRSESEMFMAVLTRNPA